MKAFIATLIGGSHEGQLVAIGTDARYLNVLVPMPESSKPDTVRFRRKIWARVVDEATREISTDTFYVLDSLSDQEATTALLQHLHSDGGAKDS